MRFFEITKSAVSFLIISDLSEEKNLNELQITKAEVKEIISSINKEWISARSQSRIISGIKAFYKYLILEDYLKVNPTELIESPRIGMKLPDTLSIEEIDSLISSIDLSSPQGERNRAIIECLYSCGLRVSELITIKISNLFFIITSLTPELLIISFAKIE